MHAVSAPQVIPVWRPYTFFGGACFRMDTIHWIGLEGASACTLPFLLSIHSSLHVEVKQERF